MKYFQVLDCARAPEVKGILTDAHVARRVALPLGDMREFVFDHGALAQRVASGGRLDLCAEPLLELFILRNGHRASVAEFGGRALRAQRTAIADVGIEFDHRAEREAVHLSVRARNRAVPNIDREGRLGKQAAVARLPRLQTIVPRRASTASTSVLLMYPR